MKTIPAIVHYSASFGEKTNREYNIEVPIGFPLSDGENGTVEILETVFRMMNHVNGSEIESQLIALKERSMSVGDKITVDGKTYRCASIGWERVY